MIWELKFIECHFTHQHQTSGRNLSDQHPFHNSQFTNATENMKKSWHLRSGQGALGGCVIQNGDYCSAPTNKHLLFNTAFRVTAAAKLQMSKMWHQWQYGDYGEDGDEIGSSDDVADQQSSCYSRV